MVDHHDAPDRRFAPVVCQASRPHGSVPIGVHLIVQPVDALAQASANAGAHNFVAGSAIFSQPDCRAPIDALRAPHAAADLKRAA